MVSTVGAVMVSKVGSPLGLPFRRVVAVVGNADVVFVVMETVGADCDVTTASLEDDSDTLCTTDCIKTPAGMFPIAPEALLVRFSWVG